MDVVWSQECKIVIARRVWVLVSCRRRRRRKKKKKKEERKRKRKNRKALNIQ